MADSSNVLWEKRRNIFGLPTETDCWCCNCFHERSSGVSPPQHGDSPGHRQFRPCGARWIALPALFSLSGVAY
jgi:hypothetical protein